MPGRNIITICAMLAASGGLAACASLGLEPDLTAEAKGDISAESSFGGGAEQVWVAKAKAQYRAGDYGLAERYFRQAVEERSENVEAWLGLAAAYDRLKKFDEADRAYKIVVKMVGNTPIVLNNLGYHYMLRGDFDSAERTLHAAARQDPKNVYVQNNLAMLEEWKVAAGKSG